MGFMLSVPLDMAFFRVFHIEVIGERVLQVLGFIGEMISPDFFICFRVILGDIYLDFGVLIPKLGNGFFFRCNQKRAFINTRNLIVNDLIFWFDCCSARLLD